MDGSHEKTTNSGSKSTLPESPMKACDEADETAQKQQDRNPGGWKSMPFILGNETCERLASIGLLANFTVFLLTIFNMDQVMASNMLNVWGSVSGFIPLIGAFISDAYLGRFKTIAYATFVSFAGMLTLTLIAWIPQLHPPSCKAQPPQCGGPNRTQLGVLAVALTLISIGSGGIRPCSLPFGVDQFDSSTDEGRRGITSFFNWYYNSFTFIIIVAMTLVVYIQDSVSWVWGFAIPTSLMLCSIILFFSGMKRYIHVKPESSCFTWIARVVIASCKKRNAKLPGDGECFVEGAYYDPPLAEGTVVKKLVFSNQFRFFNKAALITSDDSNPNPWRLCSIQHVEETKCLIRIIPIWASGIIFFLAMAQQDSFTVFQAMKMDRHLGRNFKVPAGTLSVISMITVAIWLPFYDKILVPYLRKATRIEGGITQLQRMGIGLVFSILSMIVAGLVERVRRGSAKLHAGPDGVAPITVFWLAPQLILMGFAEAFNIIGQLEFYNKEFPENMTSLANSLLSCTMVGANYLSIFVVNVVHKTTGGHGRPDWVTDNINEGRVENFYFLIAGLGAVNVMYFVWAARRYRYKTDYRIGDRGFVHEDDVELSEIKK